MEQMTWAQAFVDLGNLGAAMYILYLLLTRLFKYLDNRGRGGDKSIDRLCTKIDTLVDSNNSLMQKMGEVMINTDRDQGEILRMLGTQLELMGKMLSKIERIDIRTQTCMISKEDEDENEH